MTESSIKVQDVNIELNDSMHKWAKACAIFKKQNLKDYINEAIALKVKKDLKKIDEV